MMARTLVAGEAAGPPLRLREPLSFWGGFDAATGRIIDRHHPDRGVSLVGKVLFLARGRGSSSGSSVLAEAIRLGTAPVGIVLGMADGIVATGALVAGMLYGRNCPVAVLGPENWAGLAGADSLRVAAGPSGAIIEP